MDVVVKDGYKYLDMGGGVYALILDEDGNPVKDEAVH